MNSIEKLVKIFSQFPGIGPRQARRFVYHLLTRANGTVEELSKNILDLKKDMVICEDCHRFFESKNNKTTSCSICRDQTRDQSILMLVQRDVDLESVEKNGGFNGIYFVLGGSIPILEREPEKRIRIKELKPFIEKKIKGGLKEVILAMNWNPEGENTGNYVRKIIEPFKQIKISTLGKGLSLGTELEYTDPETMKNALQNRS